MESVKIKVKGTVHKHWTLANNFLSCEVKNTETTMPVY